MTEHRTAEIYERGAQRYLEQRPADPDVLRRAARFARAASGWRADLGCGPGIYTEALGRPVVGFDVSGAMLALARRRVKGMTAVQGDLGRLPFAPGTLGGAWARASYVHTEEHSFPPALAQLHRALRVDAPFVASVIEGDEPFVSSGDLPGRWFSTWREPALREVLVGAGFDVDGFDRQGEWLWVEARRARTLPDTVGAGMRVLVCGLNPSLHAADAGVGYTGPGNRFWAAAVAAGLVERPYDHFAALAGGIGMTDLVKRATPRAADLTPGEFRAGAARVERLVRWLRPSVVCFVGLAGYRAAVDRRAAVGWHRFGGRPAYVMPSTSGLNARTSLDELVDHLREVRRRSVAPDGG